MVKRVDPWHYPRLALAEQILGLFETGLSHALVFFAPRRMGKTEFLCKDILPLAQKKSWKTLYFSFLDVENAELEFNSALAGFIQQNAGLLSRTGDFLKKAKKIQLGSVGIELNDLNLNGLGWFKNNLSLLASEKTLLLLDEVQTLAQQAKNENFVATLRTVLDLHKDTLKVIFTGSSQAGLRRMFSSSKAPFFHFGQNLPFPELERSFTDHLADVYTKVTQRKLDRNKLWLAFEKFQKIPQLARVLVERLVLNPYLSIDEAQSDLMSELYSDREFSQAWENCSSLEKLLLLELVAGRVRFFGTHERGVLAKRLGIPNLPVHSVQSAVRSLIRKGLIGMLDRGDYYIEDQNFREWLETDSAI